MKDFENWFTQIIGVPVTFGGAPTSSSSATAAATPSTTTATAVLAATPAAKSRPKVGPVKPGVPLNEALMSKEFMSTLPPRLQRAMNALTLMAESAHLANALTAATTTVPSATTPGCCYFSLSPFSNDNSVLLLFSTGFCDVPLIVARTEPATIRIPGWIAFFFFFIRFLPSLICFVFCV